MRKHFQGYDGVNRRGIPIYDDVIQGSGGIAAGRFLFVNDDSNINYVITNGTAQSGASNTITLAAGASAVNNAYAGMSIQITGGTASGDDTKQIASYVGSTKVATVNGTWATVPDSTSVYQIVNRSY